MQALLRFLVDYQNWIYSILILIGLIYLRKLILAIIEWRSTIFGLEREYAQHKLNTSLAMVIVIALLIIAEFVSVTFVIGELPQIPSTDSIQTTSEDGLDVGILAPTAIGSESAAPDISAVSAAGDQQPLAEGACIPGQIEWISPKPGEEIKGVYDLMATINVLDMGFYKYEYAPISDTSTWLAISAGSLPVIEGKLGVLATTEIPNGDYVLRLTVVDKSNRELQPCEVSIRILNETD